MSRNHRVGTHPRGRLLQGTSGAGPLRTEVPCGARGLIRAVVGGPRSIDTRGRAGARDGVRCLAWPRGHEPGAAAQTRPAVLGPGARRVAGRGASGRRGLAGSAPRSLGSCVDSGSGAAVGGLHCALESGRAAGCLRGFSGGSYLTEYVRRQTTCLQLALGTMPCAVFSLRTSLEWTAGSV